MIKHISLLVIVLIIIVSCDIIVEPKRVFNNDSIPPSVKELSFKDVYNGKHLDGRLEIQAVIDDIDFHVTTVTIMVDDEYVHTVSPNEYLKLNTRDFEKGVHIISILVYSSERKHGMLNLLHTPSLVLQAEVIFDRTPPGKTSVVGIMTKDNIAQISWQKSSNENFYAYRVLRGRIGTPHEIIGVIYDRDSLTFFDNTLQEIYGMGYEYEVQVATDQNFEYLSYSDKISLYYGSHKRLDDFELSHTGKIIKNTSFNEYYMLGGSELVAFDMTSHELRKKIDLQNLAYEKNFTKSDDGSIIYVLDANNNTIDIIGTQNFSLLSHQNLLNEYNEIPRKNEILYMGNGRILILNDETLYYYDTKSAAVINQTKLNIYGHLIEVEKINNTKIIISSEYDDGYKLRIRNIVEPGMPVISEQVTSTNYLFMYADTIEQKLYGRYLDKNIKIHSLTTLELLETIEINNLNGFYIEDNYIYTSQHEYINMYGFANEGARVICWDKNSMTQIKSYLIYRCSLSNKFSFSTEDKLVLAASYDLHYPIVEIKK